MELYVDTFQGRWYVMENFHGWPKPLARFVNYLQSWTYADAVAAMMKEFDYRERIKKQRSMRA